MVDELSVENSEPAVTCSEDSSNANLSKVISLEILRVIKEAQQQHGLRHGDYQRYRGYCSRRIRRLRKVLKLPQGDRRHYKKRDVTIAHLESPKMDKRCLEAPLMQAERAWAYAMQLRQEANTEPRKRFHLTNRLRKACAHAIIVEDLAKSDVCDARTKLEAYAYKLWIHGSFQFETEQWIAAAENLSVAQRIYGELADSLPLDERNPYRQKYEELTPSLRYCAYNIDSGDNKKTQALFNQIQSSDILEGLDSLMEQAKQRRAEVMSEKEWRGYKFSVRPERVRLFLISIQDLDKNLKNTKDVTKRIEILEQVLMECKESINAVREEIKTDPKLKAFTDGQSSAQSLLSYLTYIRLTRTIERNLALIEQANIGSVEPNKKPAKPQDFARFYEIILQNVTELQSLSGFENDEKYQNEMNTMAKIYKGFRCFYIAKTLEAIKKLPDACALFARSADYAKSILFDKTTSDENKKLIKGLLADIDSSKFTAHAQAVLEENDQEEISENIVQKSNKKKIKKPLYERLDEYVEDPSVLTKTPNIIKVPPEMQPVPCKPLFFDLAYNFVQFPDLSDKLETKTKKSEQSAGLSGFVKGFLGWGSSKK